MAWNFEFEAKKHTRIYRYFSGATIIDDGPSLWWVYDLDDFYSWQIAKDYTCSTHSKPIRTFKSFKRFLRKRTARLVGRKVVLVNRYQGHNITAEWKE